MFNLYFSQNLFNTQFKETLKYPNTIKIAI